MLNGFRSRWPTLSVEPQHLSLKDMCHCNLGQSKKEEQTPIPRNERVKTREGHFPILDLGVERGGGGGGQGV